MPSKKRTDVPETITDRQWNRVTRAAAREVPLVYTPDTSPAAVRKLAHWTAAAENARQN